MCRHVEVVKEAHAHWKQGSNHVGVWRPVTSCAISHQYDHTKADKPQSAIPSTAAEWEPMPIKASTMQKPPTVAIQYNHTKANHESAIPLYCCRMAGHKGKHNAEHPTVTMYL